MNTYYEKDGKVWRHTPITLGGRMVWNPSHEQLLAAGYEAKERPPYVPSLDEIKQRKVAEIDRYDNSTAVNSFSIDGMEMWLDFQLREKIRARLPVEKDAGRETTTLWYNDTPIQLPIALAERLLNQIELYAINCCDATARHKAAVMALTTKEDVQAYEFKTGYPEQPVFNTNGE